MSSCPVKSKVPFLLLVDHATIWAFSRLTSISQTPQGTVGLVRALISSSHPREPQAQVITCPRMVPSWLFWPNGVAGRVLLLFHVAARAATACTPNPSSSNRKVEAGTPWQCDVYRLWSHLPTSLFMDLLLRKILFQHGWLVGLPILIHVLAQSAAVPVQSP